MNEPTPIPKVASRRRRMYVGIDLHARQERQHDRREGRDEVEPLLGVQVEDVPDDDAERQLDQRHGNAELDRDDARDEDYDCKDCGELNRLHD